MNKIALLGLALAVAMPVMSAPVFAAETAEEARVQEKQEDKAQAQNREASFDSQVRQLEADKEHRQAQLESEQKQAELQAKQRQIELEAEKRKLELQARQQKTDLEAQKKQSEMKEYKQEAREDYNEADLKEASGKVAEIDANDNQIAVRTSWLPFRTNFDLGPETVIMGNGRRMQVGELQPGDSITVQYAKKEDGRNIARSITVNEQAPTRG